MKCVKEQLWHQHLKEGYDNTKWSMAVHPFLRGHNYIKSKVGTIVWLRLRNLIMGDLL